jgi:hypothetical protein
VRAVKLAERGGEAAIHRPHDADAQAAREQAAQRHDRVAAPLGRRERRAGVREERLARAGQSHTALVTVEERLAQLALEPAQLRADRRLSDRQPRCRACDLAVLGHRDEIGEVPQLHDRHATSATRSDRDGI